MRDACFISGVVRQCSQVKGCFLSHSAGQASCEQVDCHISHGESYPGMMPSLVSLKENFALGPAPKQYPELA